MPFPAVIVARAWNRQGSRCAYCGKALNRENRDRGMSGAWHPHHRKPESEGGTDTLRNCVILCINPPNCHFHIGHGGMSWMHYESLSDSGLPYLYYGVTRRRLKARRRLTAKRRLTARRKLRRIH